MTHAPITTVARQPGNFSRPWARFPSAREAFKFFLAQSDFNGPEEVLLPAYIGWSSREGSGVFDPVAELGLPFSFYRMDGQLHIDLDDYHACLRTRPVKVVVLIHYFGYVDPGYEEAVALAKAQGAVVLEDEAHALYTDLMGGASGRLGDACIFSLHKMLPVPLGGMLVMNPGSRLAIQWPDAPRDDLPSPWGYDLYQIAKRRRANAHALIDFLQPLAGRVDPLWPPPRVGEVPQTYPVLIRRASRDKLYFSLRETGYGVVSLYHSLIEALTAEVYPASHQLARTILNLPVHQDISPADLERLVRALATSLNALED